MIIAGLFSASQVLPAAGVLLVFYLVSSTFLAWYRLRHIKGPFLASFSHLWLLRNTLSGRQAEGFCAVNDKYGPLARIGPNDVLTCDPDVTRRMGNTRLKPAYRRSSWYDAMSMDPYHATLFSIRDTNTHDKLKAKLSFGYGGRENPSLEASIDTQLASLVGLIRRKYISTDAELKPIDLATTAQYFTLDALTKVAYGYPFGYLDTDSDVYDYVKLSQEMIPGMAISGEMPWIGKILMSKIFLKLFGPKPWDKTGFGKMLGLAQELASARFAPGARDEKDMLGAFIRHGVEERECQAEILFQIIAGSDTTATALRGTLLNLLAAPHAYMRLRGEIDEAVANGSISSPVTHSEARKMPYLQAVIYEGLRINVPISLMTMKEVPPGGDTISGQFVPGGTRVGVNYLGMQRSTEVFGPDADVFRPERWLGLDKATAARRRQHVELSFGSGRWGCSGKSVAFMELNKTYVELFRRFDFQLMYPTKPMETINLNMYFQKDMWVRVTERFPEAPV